MLKSLHKTQYIDLVFLLDLLNGQSRPYMLILLDHNQKLHYFLNKQVLLSKDVVKLPEEPKPVPLGKSAIEPISIFVDLLLKPNSSFRDSLMIGWLI